MRRLLTISHSYVVAQNRRLAHEMARAGAGEWQVTAVAPRHFPGDLRPVALEALADEACSVEALDIALASSPHFFVYRGLRSILNRNWDVVHSWEEPYVAAGVQAAMLTSPRAALVPATFQNLVKRYPPPLRQFERYVLNRSRGWIAFGESVRETHHARPIYSERPVRVIPPGVDLDSFKPDASLRAAARTRLGWPDDVPVVGFIGRFIPEKGLRLLMRVLPRTGSAWRALFIGGGPLLAELRCFAAAYPGRVQIVTSAAHDDVPMHVNAMDVLCAPSQTTARWREQFGRMLIEAMACGVPVIASRSGEIPYVVGDAGAIVDEDDEAEWTRAIDALVRDTGRRRALAAAGLERVRQRYAWPVVARMHLSFFDELLAS
jgi:glycosyltransferase involved in cell wall biosynthesis